MPRKPKFRHPLRDLRAALGMSQPRFAAMVGCSAPTIQSIENGKLTMSPKIAQRIRVLTGADPLELRKGKTGKAVTPSGKPYTRADYDHWQNRFAESNPSKAQELSEGIKDSIWLILNAAARPGVNKLWPVYMSLLDWLNATRQDFKLEKSIEALLGERRFKDSLTLTYGDWRADQRTGSVFGSYYGFKDDKRRRDDEELTLEIEAIPMWSAGGNMRESATVKRKIRLV